MLKLLGKNKGQKKGAKFSALEKSMISCILLMSLCSVLFVGTTLSWFSDQISSGATVIQTGNMKMALVIVKGSDTTITTNDASVVKNAIKMTRVNGGNNDLWEPGAVFKSDVMYVQNTGELDLEYRLELQTALQSALQTALQSAPTETETETPAAETGTPDTETGTPDTETGTPDTETGTPDTETGTADAGTEPAQNALPSGLSLLDAIEFKIVAASTGDPTYDSFETIPDISDTAYNGQTADTDGTPGVHSLEARTDPNGSPTEGVHFMIIGRMSSEAGAECMGLELENPFTLVVRAQQAGFEWAEQTDPLIACTDESHASAAEAAKATPFVNTNQVFWKYEDEKHVCHCAVCEEELLPADTEAKPAADNAEAKSVATKNATSNTININVVEAHAECAKDVFDNSLPGSASVRVIRVSDGSVDYYCAVCGKRIAVETIVDGNRKLMLLETGETYSQPTGGEDSSN